MIDKFNNKLIKNYLRHCSAQNDFDRERIGYALKLLLDEGEKILGIAIIFIILGRCEDFILSFLVLMSLRIYIGGLHCSTRIRCFLFSLSFFMVSVLMAELICVSKFIGIIISMFAFINVVHCAPLPAKHRILVSKRGEKRLRNRALLIMVLWILHYILVNKRMANLILWTIIMQQMELILYRIFISKGVNQNG